jgi:hypothetical protein
MGMKARMRLSRVCNLIKSTASLTGAVISRAFQILSDPDKKAKYDRFGGDPDNRFGSQPPPTSPFSGFAQQSGGVPRSSMFEEEISPEELFQRFFGGGMGGGFGPFGKILDILFPISNIRRCGSIRWTTVCFQFRRWPRYPSTSVWRRKTKTKTS